MATLPCGEPLTAVLRRAQDFYGSLKSALPSHPLHIPGRSEPNLAVSPPWAASHKEQAPRGPVHAKPLACKEDSMGNSRSWQGGDPGQASGGWDSGSNSYLGLCELPQGNQPHGAEGGHPGGGARQFPKSQPQQEGPACPTSWQAASRGPSLTTWRRPGVTWACRSPGERHTGS